MPTKRVADMPPEEYEAHKEKKRIQARKYRASLSPEKKEEMRLRNNKKQLAKYHAASPEERRKTSKKKWQHEKAKIAAMTPEEEKAYRENRRKIMKKSYDNDPDSAKKQRQLRKNQSDEIRERRLENARIKEAEKRAAMTDEEKKEVAEYKRKYMLKRRKIDPAFRAMCDIRSRLRHARERRHITRTDLKTSQMLGCSWKEFADYIEGQFDSRMTWENKGRYTWHLDHVIPLAYFDLSKPEEEVVAANVLNHQPMWHDENMQKSATLPPVSSIPKKLWKMALALDANFIERKARPSQKKSGSREQTAKRKKPNV